MVECKELRDSGLTNEEWDDYVIKADNGTLFHTRRFLGYHDEKRFNDASLVFIKKQHIIALLPAAVIEKEGGKAFVSHPGASWGGLVYKKPLKFQEAKEVCDGLVTQARQSGCQRIEITLPPHIYQTTPSDYIPFILLQKGFVYRKRELSNVIRLSLLDKKTLLADKSVKKSINRSKRAGVNIEKESDDWQSFYKLLSMTLKEKNIKPTHTLEELLLLKQLFPEDILLWNAYKDNKLIGGRCNWQVQPGIWLFFYCACEPEYKTEGIISRLYYECILEFIEAGDRFVDIGTSSINMQVNPGLINFKENFSAFGIFRDTLIYKC